MPLKHVLVGHFVDDLYQVETVSERFRVYENYIHALGFDGATYTFFPNILWEFNNSFSPIFLHTQTYPTAFLKHYAEANFHECDFAIRVGHKLRLEKMPPLPIALDWHDYEIAGLINENETSVIEVAREDYGIRNALTIPTQRPEAGIGGMSVISSEKGARFQHLKQENMETLLRCTQLFHDISFSNSRNIAIFAQPFLQTLKNKEIQILRHLALGYRLKQIDQGISYRYATNILDELRARMGGITKDKLMYLIGQLHLLDLI
ncbi:autoinducer binding domain-containing protein [uncultured Thiothrix sp.]|uniref:autoinducer binding domain-containing protein n=1 Tax=uncultured Thiothrix sp. TaxID=223185 RepID=UPI002634BDD6|nr:autoinducer binding domain-containing protein [uncultured Thiothrix sp.]HMT94223.1 autoinducer binding domain-containing protein [Thiolinea sp.]